MSKKTMEEEFFKFESLCKKYKISKRTTNYATYSRIEIKESTSRINNPYLLYSEDLNSFQLSNFSKRVIEVLFWDRKWGITKKSLKKYFSENYVMSKYIPINFNKVDTYFGIGLKTEDLENFIVEFNLGTPHKYINYNIQNDPLALELSIGFLIHNEKQIIDYIQDKNYLNI